MTDRRPLGPPVFCSPATEETESTDDQGRGPLGRLVPLEQGAHFLAPPATETAPPPSQGRRPLGAGGLTFSAPDQP
jgi:hypothetical protein